MQQAQPAEPQEDPRYLSEQLITCIGNKRALLPFIGGAVGKVRARLGGRLLRSLDLFSGTGVVARFLKGHSTYLAANDLESYSRVANECHLANRSQVDMPALEEGCEWLRRELSGELCEGMICELYAPYDEADIRPDERVFFTRRNAAYLDTARALIGGMPAGVGGLLLAPLIAEASVHANTSGVFKGFYKNADGIGQYGGSARNALGRICGDIEVRLPLFSRFECECAVLQKDANVLIDELPEADLAYIDPPYNQHPYGSNYFLLNLLVDYRRPERVSRVSGIPPDWNRSRYNKRREAADALFDLIARCRASHCLVSYNSEGFVSQGEFLDGLGRLGRVEVCETSYAAFRGSRNLRSRPSRVKEFLFLLEK